MKIIQICLLIINLVFIGNLFSAAAKEDALKSFLESEGESYIPAGEAGFHKVWALIHSPEYQKLKANDQVRNKRGRTLLCLAIMGLRVDVVQMLLNNNESIYAIEGDSRALGLARGLLQLFETGLLSNAMGLPDSDDESDEVADLPAQKQVLEEKIKKIKAIIALIEAKEKQIQDNLRFIADTKVALDDVLNQALPVPALRNEIFEYLLNKQTIKVF